MRTKYRIACDDEFPTQMTHSQFYSITGSLKRGERESFPRWEIFKDYGKVVEALLEGKTIVFTAEEEVPF